MCNHRVRFYDHEAYLLDKASEFLLSALDGGRGGALAVVTPAHRQRLEALLAGHGSDVVFADADEALQAFMIDGLPDEARFDAVVGGLLARASRDGARRVGAFGEMVALLYARGETEAAIRLERLWEGLTRRLDFDLLCAYPMSAFADHGHRAAFDAICQAHTHVEPLERVEGAGADPDRLHRLVAQMQQAALSLDHELVRRRRSDRLLDRQAVRISAMERAQAALKDLAGHDALTGLANRRAFADRLSHAFARARRARTGLALLFVDLDDFKALNDRFGHEAGDRLLTEAGTRLNRCVRACDTVCRLGGDEFTIVMEDADAAEAALLAQRVVEALAQRFPVGTREVGLTASVGFALYPDDAADAQTLLRNADHAMYRAKTLGKGRWAAYGPAAAAGRDPAEIGDAADWLTVEDAAMQLELSRPHVVKLIVEQRFSNVLPRHGALPLIPAAEVSRVARELREPAAARAG